MSLAIGCIADDHTGATDLGVMLSRAGLRVVLLFGQPARPIDPSGCDAVIIALKSRSIPAADAVRQSLAALRSLREAGAERYFFKYCSTFDSTDEGNIGPVAEALSKQLNAGRVTFCPAFPENGRTVYGGHLFVHGRLLSESGMENHPLNPMTDPDLVRVLARQTDRAVGLVSYEALEQGVEAVRACLDGLAEEGVTFQIIDAIKPRHLATFAEAVEADVLVTGGSAVAQHLVSDRSTGSRETTFSPPTGGSAIVAGSCSTATRRQINSFKQLAPAFQVDPLRLASGDQNVEQVLEQVGQHLAEGVVLIYSTAEPEAIEAAHRELGRDAACSLVEATLAQVAKGLVDRGVQKMVVAGGETSGAVTRALGIEAVRIGPEIAPGVPWVETLSEPCLALALKSGNFGDDDFFRHALELLS